MPDSHPTDAFPCKLTLSIPLPTPHLCLTALRALSVDAELSPYVQRSFSICSSTSSPSTNPPSDPPSDLKHSSDADGTVLRVDYSATTNRMLRVAVNGFFESLGVVLGVMVELDVDVVDMPSKEGLEGVQGLEEGGGRVG